MNNLNDYNITQCQEYCKQLPFYQNIERDFDVLGWNKLWPDITFSPVATPREMFGRKETFPEYSIFSMVPFFYLKLLLEKNPKTIYDLGAGWNIFKKYIPNIIGISPTHNTDNYSDIHDMVDADFVLGHQNYFESVFSINALHFRPLTDFKAIIQEFASMIAPGGRGFLALNIMRMISQTPVASLQQTLGTIVPSKKEYDNYIRKVLSDIDLNYLIVDVDLTRMDEWMDGNIRIVFEK
jgi:hypothetical protein